ncbi:MAG: hypothetical protein SV186_02970 [Candidatus Nanohaloarchaea archaeon]|nr:hypothetical protein [Candidatus Nanohaloarchaea archaeon]
MEPTAPDELRALDTLPAGSLDDLTAEHRRTRDWPHFEGLDHIYTVTIPLDGEDYPVAVKVEQPDYRDEVEVSVFQYDPVPDYDSEPDGYAEYDLTIDDPPSAETVEALTRETLQEL